MRINWILAILMLLSAMSVAILLLLMKHEGNTALYIAQASSALSFLLLILFYRKIKKPLRSISNGINLLREQDFGSRLAHVNQHEADRIINMFNGMMQSLKEERLKLREQNHFLDLLIGVSPMGILILDDKDTVKTANTAAATFLGFEKQSELSGMAIGMINSPLGMIISSIPLGGTVTERLNDSMIYRCSKLFFMDKGFPHPFILIEKLTDEIMKAEKKSYEKVIRMIAHEVNNTMAGVNSMLSTTGQILKDSDDTTYLELAELISVCKSRCSDMSGFITSFANVVKIPDADIKRSDLNLYLKNRRILFESLCSTRNISLNLDLSPEPLIAMIDPILLEQAFINIIKNSVESIGENGSINISTTANPTTVTVTDNGSGITPEVSRMLFSPFFSTKADGQGIGLLFISDVLAKHDCKFSLATGHDGLTRFTVRFPKKPSKHI